MKNERIQVLQLAAELGVHPADVQHGLRIMKLPERQSAMGWISGQHAAVLRSGFANGVWRRRRSSAPASRIREPPAPRIHFPTCDCCQLKFAVQVPADEPAPACGVCGHCLDHQESADEEPLQRAVRAEEHLVRVRAWAAAISEKATDIEAEKNAAYATRNRWRRELVEVIMAHSLDEEVVGAICTCGEPFPCSTRQLLHMRNRGISEAVNEYESMHERKRERLLEGGRWGPADEFAYQAELAWPDDKARQSHTG